MRERERADHLRRLALEDLLVDDLERRPRARRSCLSAPAPGRMKIGPVVAPACRARRRALQEPLRLVADELGVRVVLVHERLDGRVHGRPDDAAAVARLGAQHGRDRLLEGEAQVILPPPRGGVHRDAHAQQPLGGGRERRREAPRHDALLLQLARVARAEARRGRPASDAQIAHAAGPVLEVGLEQEDRVAEAAVARALLGAQAQPRSPRRPSRDARAERRRGSASRGPRRPRGSARRAAPSRPPGPSRAARAPARTSARRGRRRPWRPTAGRGSPRRASGRRRPAARRTARAGRGPSKARARSGRSRPSRGWRRAWGTSRPRGPRPPRRGRRRPRDSSRATSMPFPPCRTAAAAFSRALANRCAIDSFIGALYQLYQRPRH